MKLEDGSPRRPGGAPEPAHKTWPGDKNRWAGVERPYDRQDVDRLSGSVHIEHTLARLGAERLWELLQTREFVAALGALTGNQALQRADQIQRQEGKNDVHWFAPILADAEAGFGGVLNVFELVKAMAKLCNRRGAGYCDTALIGLEGTCGALSHPVI